MTVHVINLDRDKERLATFLATNAHVPDIVRVAAVDGRTADRKSLHLLGVVAEDLTYSRGNVGAALSHIRLWRKTLKEGQPLTVAEDDAIFARNFQSAHTDFLERLPADWDFVLWGWNFDEGLWTEIPEGVSPSVLRCDQDALRKNIEVFRTSEIAPAVFRLHNAFGAMSYSVSPNGARVLLTTCLPLSNVNISFDIAKVSYPNNGIDCMMNAAYPLMKAYACVPPLVVSENRRETSRTHNDL